MISNLSLGKILNKNWKLTSSPSGASTNGEASRLMETFLNCPLEIDIKAAETKFNTLYPNGSIIINDLNFSPNEHIKLSGIKVYKLSDISLSEIGGRLSAVIQIKLETTLDCLGYVTSFLTFNSEARITSSIVLDSATLELDPSLAQFSIMKITNWTCEFLSNNQTAPDVSLPAPSHNSTWYEYFNSKAKATFNYAKDVTFNTSNYLASINTPFSVSNYFLRILANRYLMPKLNRFIFHFFAKNYFSKEIILKIAMQLSKPRKVYEDYNIWIAMQPKTIYIGQVEISAGKLKVPLEFKTEGMVSFGVKPALNPRVENIQIVAQSTKPLGEFKAILPLILSYEILTKIAQDKLRGMNIPLGLESDVKIDPNPILPTAQGMSFRQRIQNKAFKASDQVLKIKDKVLKAAMPPIYIDDVRVYKGFGSFIVIELKLRGGLKGDYKVAVLPVYDNLQETLAFKDFAMDHSGVILANKLDIKRSLLKVGDTLFHGQLLKKLQSLSIPVRPYIEHLVTYLSNLLETSFSTAVPNFNINNVATINITRCNIGPIDITGAEMQTEVTIEGRAQINANERMNA